MTPENIAEAIGAVLTPTPIQLSAYSIKPWCCECGGSIDPRVALVTDAVIGWQTADGSAHWAGLCRPCVQSLDAADQAETVRRLQAIRARAFS
jgi:hypothetical protein